MKTKRKSVRSVRATSKIHNDFYLKEWNNGGHKYNFWMWSWSSPPYISIYSATREMSRERDFITKNVAWSGSSFLHCVKLKCPVTIPLTGISLRLVWELGLGRCWLTPHNSDELYPPNENDFIHFLISSPSPLHPNAHSLKNRSDSISLPLTFSATQAFLIFRVELGPLSLPLFIVITWVNVMLYIHINKLWYRYQLQDQCIWART